jgi:hypothetical protein
MRNSKSPSPYTTTITCHDAGDSRRSFLKKATGATFTLASTNLFAFFEQEKIVQAGSE